MPANPIATYPQQNGLIQKQVLTATTASVTFNVPQNFTNLRLVTNSKATSADNGFLQATFNGDSGANYGYNYFANFFGSSVAATSNASGQNFAVIGAAGNNGGDGSATDVTIANYAGSFEKMILGNATGDAVGAMTVTAAYRVTAAITSITLTPSDGGSFLAGSTFALYGS